MENLRFPSFPSKNINWEGYDSWINQEYRAKSAYDRIMYAKRYAHVLSDGDCSEIVQMKQDKRNHVMCALSTLSKYMGVYDQWKVLVKNYGLKWTVRDDSLIIARLTKAKDSNDLFNWIVQLKMKCPSLVDFIDYMIASGLRYEEGINSYNLIVKLSKERTFEKDYYNLESGALEHFRFKDVFLRRNKKAFISFVPSELIERIQGKDKTLHKFYVQSKAKRAVGYVRFSDIREAYATLMTKYLKESEINFLQGRVTSGVFMQHYFNPSLISDLRERVLEGVKEILAKSCQIEAKKLSIENAEAVSHP
jgi:hypothetical protein